MRASPYLVILSLLLGACRTVAPVASIADVSPADRLRGDIGYLASARLEGRGTGTAGNDSAAAWIARRDSALGLRPMSTDETRAECRTAPAPVACRTFFQRFVARGPELVRAGRPDGVTTQNVIAMIPGREAALASEYVVIGAHYDHLGRSPNSAMDADAGDVIRPGADDNVSGAAAVLELARVLVASPARRSIIIAHFTGEELGLLGSQWFVEHAPVAADSISAMLNFDMVGRLRADRLIVYGTGTASELPGIVSAASAGTGLSLASVADGFGPSDQTSFYARGIPVLQFFTGLHDDYHRASDVAERIDAAGEARVVTLAERIVRAIADRPARLTPIRAAGPPPSVSAGPASKVYLGTIPDMSGGTASGLALAGVRPGSPADAAGLRAGDVIVALGGAAVHDLYSYSAALYSHQPGDTVVIEFVRGGAKRSATVVLGTRGG